ncbi:unnamed protein product [Protopolystoma xenopodis]|uniref:Uncharacterized protein n=1 Tax=Protopolystoma xenopodis TaxID=117903 RepID=A0A3S4ZXV7_9PLAT|nr:unnamed protein product [Protopolystoma xenopodis]
MPSIIPFFSHKPQIQRPINKAVKTIFSEPYSNVIICAPVVAHAAVCLLVQAFVGWPVSVPSRLVADLAQWLIDRIAQLQLDSEVTGDAKTSTIESPAVMYLMNCTNDSFSPLFELIDSVPELGRLRSKAKIEFKQRNDELEAAVPDQVEAAVSDEEDYWVQQGRCISAGLIMNAHEMLLKIPGLIA